MKSIMYTSSRDSLANEIDSMFVKSPQKEKELETVPSFGSKNSEGRYSMKLKPVKKLKTKKKTLKKTKKPVN